MRNSLILALTVLVGTTLFADGPVRPGGSGGSGSGITNGSSGVALSGTFSGDGGALTNLNATNLVGIVSLARLPSAVVTNNTTVLTILDGVQFGAQGVPGRITASYLELFNGHGYFSSAAGYGDFMVDGTNRSAYFVGDGSMVINLQSSNIVGLVSGSLTNNSAVAWTNNTGFYGNALGLTNLQSSNIVGLVSGSLTNNSAVAWTNNTGLYGNAGGLTNVQSTNLVGAISTSALPMSALSLINSNQSLNIANGVVSRQFPGPSIMYTFSTNVSTPGGDTAIREMDLNYDGWPDAMSFSWTATRLNFMTNNRAGVLKLAQTLTNMFGWNFSYVTPLNMSPTGYSAVAYVSGSTNLVIATNNGLGLFTHSQNLMTPFNNDSVGVMDLNHDGYDDLITVHGTQMAVFTNNRSGVFVLACTNNNLISGGMDKFAAADFNGDGWQDLAVAGTGWSAIAVLTNNQLNGLVGATNFNVSSGVSSVAVLDANGDGRQDIVCGFTGNTITVYTNDSKAYFVGYATMPTSGLRPWVIKVGDINGDGLPDIYGITSGGATRYQNSWIATGYSGTPYAVYGYYPLVGSDYTDSLMLDMDHDGTYDMLACTYSGADVSVFTGSRLFSGTFSGNGAQLTNLYATNITGVPAGTLTNASAVAWTNNTGMYGNAFGLTNLQSTNIVGSIATNSLPMSTLSLINSNQSFNIANGAVSKQFPGPSVWYSFGTNVNAPWNDCALREMDINYDGWPDFISFSWQATRINFITNDRAGVPKISQSITNTLGGNNVSYAVPFNMSPTGYSALAYVAVTTNLMIWTNNGAGLFSLGQNLKTPFANASVGVMDLNKDGYDDLVTTYTTQVAVFTNNRAGQFVLACTNNLILSGQDKIVSADFNGDGWSDLAFGGTGWSVVVVLTNNQLNGLVSVSGSFNVSGGVSSLAALDANGDGKPDLVSGFTGNTVVVYTNDGKAAFTAYATMPGSGSNPWLIHVADINGDGLTDVYGIASGGSVRSQRSWIATGNSANPYAIYGYTTNTITSDNLDSLMLDMDHDGIYDVLTSFYSSYDVYVMYGARLFTGTFSGNGAQITNISPTSVAGVLTNAPSIPWTNNTGLYGNGAGLTNVNPSWTSDTKDPTGLVDATNATFTITGNGTTNYLLTWNQATPIKIYRNGLLTLTNGFSVSIPTNRGLWYVYLTNANGGLGVSTNVWDFSDIQICTVFNDPINTNEIIINEQHGIMQSSVHAWLHSYIGTVLVSGTGFTVTTNSQASITMSTGQFRDEDILHTSAQTTNLWLAWRDGTSGFLTFKAPGTLPYVSNTATTYIRYDNNGVLTDLPNGGPNSYMNVWYYAVPIYSPGSYTNMIVGVIGRTNGSIAVCDAEAIPPLLPGFMSVEGVLLYRGVWRNNTGVQFTKWVDYRPSNSKVGTSYTTGGVTGTGSPAAVTVVNGTVTAISDAPAIPFANLSFGALDTNISTTTNVICGRIAFTNAGTTYYMLVSTNAP